LNTPASAHVPRLVSELGERGAIDRILGKLHTSPAGLLVGPGDDAAVVEVERGALQVLTTDALVEGVHFDLRYSSPVDVGYKALAVNVSDVAAMGGTPAFALLSLMLPESCTTSTLDGLVDGLIEMASEARVTLAGGNITRSPGPLVVDVTVTGSVRHRRVLRRSGAASGAKLYVSGTIGAAAAGLGWLRAQQMDPIGMPPSELLDCVQRHRRPAPRFRLGTLLGRNKAASACMDLSDGLADAVRQISEASGTGAVVDAALLPIHSGAAAWFSSHGLDPVLESLRGGDDYELLFAVPPKVKGRLRHVASLARGLSLTHIGELTPSPSIVLRRDGTDSPLPSGFVHF
jgi:thiamine-monophosphate kinase